MTIPLDPLPESAVYTTTDICALFDCSPNEVPGLLEAGIVPQPLPTTGPRGKRRWLKATVDKKLGRAPEQRLLRDIIREEVRRAVAGEAT
jgi:hypothetical protein